MPDNLSTHLSVYFRDVIQCFSDEEEAEGGGAWTLFLAACEVAQQNKPELNSQLYDELQRIHDISEASRLVLERAKNDSERLAMLADDYLRSKRAELIVIQAARINLFGL